MSTSFVSKNKTKQGSRPHLAVKLLVSIKILIFIFLIFH